MLGPLSQCTTCARLRPWYATGQPTASCEAFPGGIPDAVWTNSSDHRQEIPGDHGLRWEPNGNESFPEWALPETEDADPDDDHEYAAA